MKVVTIAGSPSLHSRSSSLLAYAADYLESNDIEHQAIVVRALPAEALLFGNARDPEIEKATRLVQEASGIIIATPVYKAAYAGVLKTFLDLLPQDGFAGKVVLPIATGGSQAHMLAVDYALRPVLTTLGARTVLNAVYAVDRQIRIREDGSPDLDEEIALRLDDGLEQLHESLTWNVHLRTLASLSSAPARPADARCST